MTGSVAEAARTAFRVRDTESLLSPSLVIFTERVDRNLAAMVAIAGSPDRLRPHVKTHKMPALIRRLEALGIRKHKCATIAEAEMVAQAGGTDILLAYPVVGPNLARLARLVGSYPTTTFRATVDHPQSARLLAEAMAGAFRSLPTLVDLDIGMGRTGIDPAAAAELAVRVDQLPGLAFDGLQAYDGHVRDSDPAERRQTAEPGLAQVVMVRNQLLALGLPVNRLVLGGTPTFPIHAAVDLPGVECSPGTVVLYDAGYAAKFPDLPFEPAAALLTRVVSLPRPGRACLDLGHKAVAADPVGVRLTLVDYPDATVIGQSEEHLVIEGDSLRSLLPGDALWALPTHICPTCALHSWAYVVEDGEVVDRWRVEARDRVIGI